MFPKSCGALLGENEMSLLSLLTNEVEAGTAGKLNVQCIMAKLDSTIQCSTERPYKAVTWKGMIKRPLKHSHPWMVGIDAISPNVNHSRVALPPKELAES